MASVFQIVIFFCAPTLCIAGLPYLAPSYTTQVVSFSINSSDYNPAAVQQRLISCLCLEGVSDYCDRRRHVDRHRAESYFCDPTYSLRPEKPKEVFCYVYYDSVQYSECLDGGHCEVINLKQQCGRDCVPIMKALPPYPEVYLYFHIVDPPSPGECVFQLKHNINRGKIPTVVTQPPAAITTAQTESAYMTAPPTVSERERSEKPKTSTVGKTVGSDQPTASTEAERKETRGPITAMVGEKGRATASNSEPKKPTSYKWDVFLIAWILVGVLLLVLLIGGGLLLFIWWRQKNRIEENTHILSIKYSEMLADHANIVDKNVE